MTDDGWDLTMTDAGYRAACAALRLADTHPGRPWATPAMRLVHDWDQLDGHARARLWASIVDAMTDPESDQLARMMDRYAAVVMEFDG